MSERDPRTNPRPGDVLRKAGFVRHIRNILFGGRLDIRVEKNGRFVRTTRPSFYQQRKWAATAEVLTRAEEAEGGAR